MQLIFIFVLLAISNIEGKENFKNLGEAPFLKESISNVDIEQSIEIEFDIDKDTIYSFTIKNENYLYSFISNKENIFYIQKEEEKYIIVPNETFFRNGEEVFVNYEKKLGESTKIKISPIPLYKELNTLETIKENKYFFIESEKKSILYLDSFDRNSSIYISQTFKKEIFENDTKINGHFYVIEPSITYLIKIRIYSNYSVSSVKKYLYPFDFEKIDIKDDEKNFLYLKKDKSYTLDFKDNTINKMLKLSLKTLNSNIKINESDNLVINKDSQYYKLENDFKGQLILEVDNDDAFIEFLSNKGEPEFLDEISVKEHKLEKDVVVISIPRTHKFFSLDIKSEKI